MCVCGERGCKHWSSFGDKDLLSKDPLRRLKSRISSGGVAAGPAGQSVDDGKRPPPPHTRCPFHAAEKNRSDQFCLVQVRHKGMRCRITEGCFI